MMTALLKTLPYLYLNEMLKGMVCYLSPLLLQTHQNPTHHREKNMKAERINISLAENELSRQNISFRSCTHSPIPPLSLSLPVSDLLYFMLRRSCTLNDIPKCLPVDFWHRFRSIIKFSKVFTTFPCSFRSPSVLVLKKKLRALTSITCAMCNLFPSYVFLSFLLYL